MTSGRLTGRLLVASPVLRDPNFQRSVVLVLEHADDGAIGLVVNRRTPVPVAEVLPLWEPLVSEPEVVFSGGPVSLDAVLGLVAVAPTVDLVGLKRIGDSWGFLDLDTPPEVVEAAVGFMRIFAGYAGWGAGQLDDEIGQGAWYVIEASPEDPFGRDPEGLWRRVLRRQGGELAIVATFPDDASLN